MKTVILTENEAKAIMKALERGAWLDLEDVYGLILKSSGKQLVDKLTFRGE